MKITDTIWQVFQVSTKTSTTFPSHIEKQLVLISVERSNELVNINHKHSQNAEKTSKKSYWKRSLIRVDISIGFRDRIIAGHSKCIEVLEWRREFHETTWPTFYLEMRTSLVAVVEKFGTSQRRSAIVRARQRY